MCHSQPKAHPPTKAAWAMEKLRPLPNPRPFFPCFPSPRSKPWTAEQDRAALTHHRVAKVQHTGDLLNNRGFPTKINDERFSLKAEV